MHVTFEPVGCSLGAVDEDGAILSWVKKSGNREKSLSYLISHLPAALFNALSNKAVEQGMSNVDDR